MALIKCPECNKEINDKAKECPDCGCPLSEILTEGMVRIKMPDNITIGWPGLLSSRKAIVKDSNGVVLWEGSYGENATLSINKPTDIIIELGDWTNPVSERIEPEKKYSLIQDMGVQWLATFRLTENK